MDDAYPPPADPATIRQNRENIVVSTEGRGFYDITNRLGDWLGGVGALDGLVTLFVRHTSASLTIQENADPDVRADLMDALAQIAPQDAGYRHAVEGPDDMPAHIKAMLTSVSLSVPVVEGRPALGTWQGIYLIEHRTAPHDRTIVMHFLGLHH